MSAYTRIQGGDKDSTAAWEAPNTTSTLYSTGTATRGTLTALTGMVSTGFISVDLDGTVRYIPMLQS